MPMPGGDPLHFTHLPPHLPAGGVGLLAALLCDGLIEPLDVAACGAHGAVGVAIDEAPALR